MTNIQPKLLPYDDAMKLEQLVERHGIQMVFNSLNNVARLIAQEKSSRPIPKPEQCCTIPINVSSRNRVRIPKNILMGE